MTDIDTFRQDVREWLEAHCPISQRQPIVREEQIWAGSQSRFPSDDARHWFEAMRDKRLDGTNLAHRIRRWRTDRR